MKKRILFAGIGLLTAALIYFSVGSADLAEKASRLEKQIEEDTQEEASGEGMLPEPEDPEQYTEDHLIFIGDSRTVAMQNAVGDAQSTWKCQVGMGYVWMSGTAIPEIEEQIDDRTTVIILMGVNDVGNLKNYISCINAKANEWAGLGAATCYVSVGPVENDPYVTNEQIETFNASMQASLVGVDYIDLYGYLTENGYSTTDGIHYPDQVTISAFNYIISQLEKSSGGIWG